MEAIVKCDVCKKVGQLIYAGSGVWKKPATWMYRKNHGNAQIVCGDNCARKLGQAA